MIINSTSGYVPPKLKIKTQADICTPLSMEALFTIAKWREQPKHSSTVE